MNPDIPMTPRVRRALIRSATIAKNNGDEFVGTEHLFLALLEEDGSVPRILECCDINPVELRVKVREFFAARPTK